MNRLKLLIASSALIFLAGCSTIQEYWPRKHDPVMFNHLVTIEYSLSQVSCESPSWDEVKKNVGVLALYTEYRNDPQRTNIAGLRDHIEKLSNNANKTFCELGKRTAVVRLTAARKAWEGR
jgi:hypothetical protein